MLERISGWSRKRKIIVGCLVGIVILLVISAIVSGFESEESKAARAEATAVAVQAKEAEEAEKRKSGLHCLSPFDGNHGGLEELVKDNLTDPGSLEVIETTVSAANENGKTDSSWTSPPRMPLADGSGTWQERSWTTNRVKRRW